MTCRKVIRKLSAYLANELPGWARSRVEKHLRHCVLCTGELRALKRTDQLLDTLGEVEPRRDLVGLVMRRIEREQEAIPAFKRFLISLGERRPQLVRSAAYVVALLMLAFGLHQYYQARSPAANDGVRPMASVPGPTVSTRPELTRAFAPVAQLGKRLVLVLSQRQPAREAAPEGEEFTFRLDRNGVESLNRELENARDNAD
jgi:anti-sigma factor RsiW